MAGPPHPDLPLSVADYDAGLSYITSSRGLPADGDEVPSDGPVTFLAEKLCGHYATAGCNCTTKIDSKATLCHRCRPGGGCGAQTAARQDGQPMSARDWY